VSIRDNTHGIYRRSSNGEGKEEQLYQHTSGAPIVLTDWSADGRFLCFWSADTMFLLPLTGERKAIEFSKAGRGGRLSPDSRFLAFNSNQSGSFQVYVSPFDPSATASAASTPAQVSGDGGLGGIMWRKDGRELFYLSQPPVQRLMAVEVTPSPAFQTQTPRPLFALPIPVGPPAQLSAVSSADGQRFVFAVNLPTKPAR
jgi:Tol biopolymer transport system component